MTPAEFTAWKTQMGLSIPAAANALGISESSVSRYLSGSHAIPRYIELACAALAVGVTGYPAELRLSFRVNERDIQL